MEWTRHWLGTVTRLAAAALLFPVATACTADRGDTDLIRHEDEGDVAVIWDDPAEYGDWASALQQTEIPQLIADGVNSTYALPRDLTLGHAVCDMENAFYITGEDTIIICYEMVVGIYSAFYQADWGWSDEEVWNATLSTWVFIIYHELGHALTDYYDLPITGKEEDAVDQFSSVVLIQGGLPDAAVYASLYWMLTDAGPATQTALADEHGLNMQRMYNMLCWVYGADPSTYSYLPQWFPELEHRIGRCEAEYEQTASSWNTLLAPWEM